MTMKPYKLALSYLRTRRPVILLVALVWATCAVVYFAYNLPMEPLLYAILLGSVLMLPALIIDCVRFAEKHNILDGIRETCGADLRQLPQTGSAIEQAYQEIILCIDNEKRDLVSAGDIRQREASEYYTMWVHQIKTPIAAARLVLQAEESAVSPKLMGELLQIEQYADMALNYTRLESIHSDLALQWCLLDDIIRKALKKLSRIFLLKKISMDFSETNVKVLTDEKWLGFILEQLLSNALKYSGGGMISVFLAQDRPKTLVIQDYGMGIRPEDLPRVFEKGFTGYNGRQDKKSTGIGLYMCKKVGDVLSHKIELVSAPGKGTGAYLDLNTADMKVE